MRDGRSARRSHPRGPGGPASNRRSALLVGAVLWLSVATLALLGPDRATLGPSLVVYTVAFAALARLWLSHRDVLGNPLVVIGGAVLLRLTVFPTLPDLSDDLYRYVWDGWLSVSGINPFRYVPSDPRLAPFQVTDLFAALNSPDYYSIYPPLSQAVFTLGGMVYEMAGWPLAAYAVKAGFVALETAGVFFLLRASQALGRSPADLVLYAWNPLVLVTLIGGGHTESGLVFGMGILAWAVASERRSSGWIGLALATASKGIPILLAPLLLRRDVGQVGWTRALAGMAPGALLGLLLLAPFYFPGLLGGIAASANLYVRLFEFNAGLYLLMEEVLRSLTGQDWGRTIGPLLRWAFLIAAAVVWIRWPIREPRQFFGGGLLLMGLYLITATTVHPWYLTWGLVWVPFTTFLRGPWMWASWAGFLTYLFYVGVPRGPLATMFWGGVAALVLLEYEKPLKDRLLRFAGRRKARQVRSHLLGDVVLDLGAGEGYVGRALARGARRVVLVDVGPFFRVRLPSFVYDGWRLPLPDRSVDTVLVSLALHHAGDPDVVLDEALRVARLRVLVTESVYRHAWERRLLEVVDRWANRTRGMAESRRDAEPLHFRTVQRWEESFRSRGARIIRSERLNRIGHRHHLFVLEPATGVGTGGAGRAQIEGGI